MEVLKILKTFLSRPRPRPRLYCLCSRRLETKTLDPEDYITDVITVEYNIQSWRNKNGLNV